MLLRAFQLGRRRAAGEARRWRGVGPLLALVLASTACTPRVEDEDPLLNARLPSQTCQGTSTQVCVVDTIEGTRKRLRASGLQPNSDLRVNLSSDPLRDPGRTVRTVRADDRGGVSPAKGTEFKIPGTIYVLLVGTTAQQEPVSGALVVTTDVPPLHDGPPPS